MLCCFQGSIQRRFGECVSFQFSSPLRKTASYSIHRRSNRDRNEQLQLVDQQARASAGSNTALHLQLPSEEMEEEETASSYGAADH